MVRWGQQDSSVLGSAGLSHSPRHQYDSAPANRKLSQRLFNSQNFAGYTALSEAYALLNAILVYNFCFQRI